MSNVKKSPASIQLKLTYVLLYASEYYTRKLLNTFLNTYMYSVGLFTRLNVVALFIVE